MVVLLDLQNYRFPWLQFHSPYLLNYESSRPILSVMSTLNFPDIFLIQSSACLHSVIQPDGLQNYILGKYHGNQQTSSLRHELGEEELGSQSLLHTLLYVRVSVHTQAHAHTHILGSRNLPSPKKWLTPVGPLSPTQDDLNSLNVRFDLSALCPLTTSLPTMLFNGLLLSSSSSLHCYS